MKVHILGLFTTPQLSAVCTDLAEIEVTFEWEGMEGVSQLYMEYTCVYAELAMGRCNVTMDAQHFALWQTPFGGA